MMRGYVRFVVKNRLLVLATVGALLGLSLWSLSHGVISNSLGELFFGESPAFIRYQAIISEYGSDEAVIVGIEGLDLTQDADLVRLERVADRLIDVDQVGRVMSLANAQRVRGTEDGVHVDKWSTLIRKTPQSDRKALLKDLAADKLSGGVVLSKDGSVTAIVIELTPDPARDVNSQPKLVEDVLAIIKAEGVPAGSVHIVGMPALMSEMMAATKQSMQVVFPFVAFVLLFTVWLLFRRLWPVMMSLGISVLAVIMMMGISVAIDPAISIMHSIAPTVILIVGFSDVIHLCSAYLLELQHGHDKDTSIENACSDVGRACVYTSVTTFCGFVGMAFVPTPVFRLLGVILGSGVGLALLLAVTLVPIAFSFMKQPKPWRVGATSRVQKLLDRLLAWCAHVSIHRSWLVIGAFAVGFGVAAVGLSRVYIDASMSDRLAGDNPVTKDGEWFDKHFSATDILQVLVTAPATPAQAPTAAVDPDVAFSEDDFADEDFGEDATSEKSEPPPPDRDSMLQPDAFAGLVRLVDGIEKRADVDTTNSLVNLMEHMHHQLAPGQGRLPTTKEGLHDYLLMFELGGGEDMGRLMEFHRRTAMIQVRLDSDAGRASAITAAGIVEDAKTLMPGAKVEPTGMLHLLGDWLDDIIAGQQRGLVFTFVAIGILMMIGLGSVRVGLWSLIPNALPLLFLGGWLGLWFETVDSDLLILAMLAIGIGVDDTIHFVMRYRVEAERTKDLEEALHNTFDYAGRAIVMTTLVLGLGFAPMMTSDYTTNALMGFYLPLTLFFALIADLLLVPAMAKVGLMRFNIA